MLLRVGMGLICLLALVEAARGEGPSKPAAASDKPSVVATPDAAWRTRVRRELAALKSPAIPAGAGQPVDALLAAWWRKQSLAPPPTCDDRIFFRRVHLDLIGLLPNEKELAAFLADQRLDKRERAIEELLANRRAYAEHWMTFWNDLLRNDEAPMQEATRRSITPWLYHSLLENRPYDLFAADLIAPALTGPVGFVQGIDWNFSVSASEVPPMQAARSVAQVFQGINLKCASCHDSFTGQRKLDEAWNLAACFAEVPLEMYRCDKPNGRLAKAQFVFPELGQVPADAPLESRREAVAVMATRPRNPRFAKVIVNRLFRQLFGQGLIDAVDDLDSQEAFDPALLDYLAYDLAAHDYDLTRTLRLLATSQAYQSQSERGAAVRGAGGELSSSPGAHSATEGRENGVAAAPKPKSSPVSQRVLFRGPRAKRMTAEQFADAVATLTGCWPKSKVMQAELGEEPARAWRAVNPDALATALGRPGREVINSVRLDEATPLQALELISGVTLRQRLSEGADRLLAGPLGKEPDVENVVQALCRRAYCREPTPAEIQQGRELLGTPGEPAAKRHAGWEDFLWLIVMRREFQYVE